MKVLVTGARGLLGTELVRVLARNHQVIPFTRAEADLADEKATREAIARARPEAIIHAAALTDVDACEGDPERDAVVKLEGVLFPNVPKFGMGEITRDEETQRLQ